MEIIATRLSDLVVEFRHVCKVGEVQEYILLSDLHIDHPKTDQRKVWKLMDDAANRGARFLINGDTLCLMQGKKDKRGSKSDIRPEHLGANYFDKVAIDIAEKLSPWASAIAYIGDGNHETSIIKHHEVDVLGNMIHRLNSDHGGSVIRGGYQGYLMLKFCADGNSNVRTHILYHHHGKYGGEVTKGALGVNRYAAIHPSADTIWSGHTHDAWYIQHPQMIVKRNGEVQIRNQTHIKTGTAKQDFVQSGGFAVERLNKPAALTMWSMRLSRESDRGNKIALNVDWKPIEL